MTAQPHACPADTAPFKELLLRTCGFSFENERQDTLVAALKLRMSASGEASYGGYLRRLSRDPDELRRLVELLTVNETYFFREPDQLRLIAERCVPEMLALRPGAPVQILSAGCATGEEPYSLAMLLRDALGPGEAARVRITGVDIDSSVVAAARLGAYTKSSFRGGFPSDLARHFEATGKDGWRLTPAVRHQVRFETANLLAEDLPAALRGMDIILYRNVSIYFPAPVQKQVFSRLADCLNDGGYLLVGATETLHHDIGVLTLVEMDSLFIYRKLPGPRAEDRRAARRVAGLTGPDRNARPAPSPLAGNGSAPARPAPPARFDRTAPAAPQPAGDAAGRRHEGARALFDDALEHARDGRLEEALQRLNAVLELDAGFIKAHTLKGSIMLGAHRLQEAKAACELALSNDPLCLEAKLILGLAALHEEDREAALKRFREAIYLDTCCWLAHFYLAEIMYLLGEKKRARGAYEATARILEDGPAEKRGRDFFPLAVNAQAFKAICRHKLALLK